MSDQTFGRAARAAWDKQERRALDIKTEHQPNGEWTAIDRNTYDGAPDAGRAGSIGWGTTEQDAIDDLIEKLS